MARKRMFDLDIINQESFFDLPMDTKALYFLLGMEADDEGFVSPKKVLRLYGGTEDSLKVLATKKYIIPFESGVIVITDWKRNNYLQKDRIKPTIYQEEKQQIVYDEDTQKYTCLTNDKQMFNKCLTNVNIEENSIEENSIVENNIYSLAEQDKIPYKDIIDYLNFKTNSNYKTTTGKTRDLIKARFNEGFKLEDFKTVIDKKTNEWLNDEEMKIYLRPQTLFGTKFESYLNQKEKQKKETNIERLNRHIKELEEEERNKNDKVRS